MIQAVFGPSDGVVFGLQSLTYHSPPQYPSQTFLQLHVMLMGLQKIVTGAVLLASAQLICDYM